jgi:AcrR family transcriptional regulator
MDAKQRLTQPLSEYRQHKREAMIARILETARGIMREEGVAALSMQELARRMNLRAPSLYNYFTSKMDIYDTLFRLGFTLFGEYMGSMGAEAQTWQEEIKRQFEGYMTFAKENPELYQLCFERPVPGFTPSKNSLQLSFGMLNRGYEQMTRYLPEMDTDLNAQQMVDLMIAFMHGLTAQHMANEPGLPLGEGRFGSLIPAALTVLDKALAKK